MNGEPLSSLIERAQQRQADAFDALVDRFGSRLYGYLYRLTGSRENAEDLVQEVYVRLVRMLPDYVHDDKFEGWLFRIATNLVRDWVRRKRRSPLSISFDAQALVSESGPSWQQLCDLAGPTPDHEMNCSEEADLLQRALAELPAAEREVVLLRHFSGMSFAEIADAMQTPLGTALARGHRGLARLRELVGDVYESARSNIPVD